MVIQGTLTAEQLTSFVFYVEFAIYSSLSVCNEFASLMEAVGASQRVMAMLDAKAADQISKGIIPVAFRGVLELENVVFK